MSTYRELRQANDRLADELAQAQMEGVLQSLKTAFMEGLLKMAMPYMQRAEQEAGQKRLWEEARNVDQLANWPLKKLTLWADGLKMVVQPNIYGRHKTRETEINDEGQEAGWVETTTGDAAINIYLPFFGKRVVSGKLTHIERGHSETSAVEIENNLRFELELNGETCIVTVTTRGNIEGWSDTSILAAYTAVEAKMQTEWCGLCQVYHHTQAFEADISVS